jgi:hypothetical protein
MNNNLKLIKVKISFKLNVYFLSKSELAACYEKSTLVLNETVKSKVSFSKSGSEIRELVKAPKESNHLAAYKVSNILYIVTEITVAGETYVA